MIRNRKAIALFSGGLDSILSVKYMQYLGYTVYPIFFQTPYLPSERAVLTAERNGLELEVIDITEEHLNMVKNPRYGFGKNVNPCIDCHALMFNLAGNLLKKYGADFLISGEVLGQRPMSQRRDALAAVAKTSGYKDLLIRPLCQKLLADTLPITLGWIDKDEMLAISGRSRYRQEELADKIGVQYYPQPGGGCRLTDANYALRLRDLLQHDQADSYQIRLLNYGRHFRLSPSAKLILGRDEQDNEKIETTYETGLFIDCENYAGPLGLLLSENNDEEILRRACEIYLYYVKKAPEICLVSYGEKYPLDRHLSVKKAGSDTVSEYIISYPGEKK